MLALNPCGLTSSKALVLRFVSFSPRVKGAITALMTWHACFRTNGTKESVAIGNWIFMTFHPPMWKMEQTNIP